MRCFTPSFALRCAVPLLALLLAGALASPAAALPQFCGCWCQFDLPATQCTDVTVFGYVVTTCGDWLSRNGGECQEPWPRAAGLEEMAAPEAVPETPMDLVPAPTPLDVPEVSVPLS